MICGRALRSSVLTLGLLTSACVTTGPVADVEPGERPNVETDEAGFWMVMDRAERQLRSSGRLETDPELNAYVRRVVCRLKPDYCQDIRIYIVNVANFNATMAPNGVMQVWTGALLRLENEAQLAFVLGHEFGHYQKRHTIQQWRAARETTDALAFLAIPFAIAGPVGTLAHGGVSVAAAGSLAGYSRDHESEADAIGFDLAVEAGYDPREGAKIWQRLKEERDAGEEDERSIFFASHPQIEERIENLSALADQATYDENAVVVAEDQYIAATASFRSQWLSEEVRKRNYGQTEVVLDRLIDTGKRTGELHFYQGELYRREGGEENDRKAVEAYEKAKSEGDAPVDLYRSLGLVYWDLEETEKAREAFQQYLAKAPYAGDRAIVESYLNDLSGETS